MRGLLVEHELDIEWRIVAAQVESLYAGRRCVGIGNVVDGPAILLDLLQTVVLRVANDVPPGSPVCHATESLAATGGGYGLNGLTERAGLLGGTLHAGPGENGWVVELMVPG